jgi:integrase/recombinase XerD
MCYAIVWQRKWLFEAHGYIEADLALKEQALSKVASAGQKTKRFRADDDLLRFLSSL